MFAILCKACVMIHILSLHKLKKQKCRLIAIAASGVTLVVAMMIENVQQAPVSLLFWFSLVVLFPLFFLSTIVQVSNGHTDG